MDERWPDADIEALTRQRDRLKRRGSDLERMLRAQQLEALRKEIIKLGEEPCR